MVQTCQQGQIPGTGNLVITSNIRPGFERSSASGSGTRRPVPVNHVPCETSKQDRTKVGKQSPHRPDFQNDFAYLGPSVFRAGPIFKFSIFRFSKSFGSFGFRFGPSPNFRDTGFLALRIFEIPGFLIFQFSGNSNFKISKIWKFF